MKSQLNKFKIIIVISIVAMMMVFAATYLFPGWVDLFLKNMKAGGTFASIVYAFMFILGFNLLIFLIGKMSNKGATTNGQIRKMKRIVKSGRTRRAEIRQAYLKMGQT